MPPFTHFDLRMPTPRFDDPLTATIMELDHLRKRWLAETTPPPSFEDIKALVHTLAGLASARIEGNRTTITDLVEARLAGTRATDEALREITNQERAMAFVEAEIEPGSRIMPAHVAEMHRMTVEGLTAEGDPTPGVYRQRPVAIAGAEHTPPDHSAVAGYMDELFAHVNREHPPQYQLLAIAIAHHRFAWIHPYRNGNGRTVRLLTYAMLISQGFKVRGGRPLNPNATFVRDREAYYQHLALADTGASDGLLSWCRYMLGGLVQDVRAIDTLLNREFLYGKILVPAISECREAGHIQTNESEMLLVVAELGTAKRADLMPANANVAQRTTRAIGRLRNAGLIVNTEGKEREYRLSLSNNVLMRHIINTLRKEGFVAGLD